MKTRQLVCGLKDLIKIIINTVKQIRKKVRKRNRKFLLSNQPIENL